MSMVRKGLPYFACAIVAMAVALAVAGFWHRRSLLARYLGAQTPRSADDRLADHFRQIRELGTDGVPLLVEALNSRRPAERFAAVLVLDELVARQCAREDPDAEILRTLICSLADRAAALSGRSRAAAQRWANRLQSELPLREGADPGVLGHCDRLLIALAAPSSDADNIASLGTPEEMPQAFASQADPLDSESQEPLASLPTPEETPAPLPAEQTSSVGDQELLDTGSAAGVQENSVQEPEKLPPETLETAQPIVEQATQSDETTDDVRQNSHVVQTNYSEAAERAEPPSGPAATAGGVPSSVQRGGDQAAVAAADPEPATAPVASEEPGIREALSLLHHQQADVAERAEQILLEHGLSATEIALGRLLTHPDPTMRAQLALSLPRMHQVDRIVWLLEMTRDPEVVVRMAALEAIGQLPPDSQLDERAQIMARDDPNAWVRERAAELLGLATTPPPLPPKTSTGWRKRSWRPSAQGDAEDSKESDQSEQEAQLAGYRPPDAKQASVPPAADAQAEEAGSEHSSGAAGSSPAPSDNPAL